VIRWGVHPEPEHAEPTGEIVLPQRLVPLREAVTAKDVVDQNVEPSAFVVDPAYERLDLGGFEMVDSHCPTVSAGGPHQVAGLLDRFGSVDL
jgi:hypothetical protein